MEPINIAYFYVSVPVFMHRGTSRKKGGRYYQRQDTRTSVVKTVCPRNGCINKAEKMAKINGHFKMEAEIFGVSYTRLRIMNN